MTESLRLLTDDILSNGARVIADWDGNIEPSDSEWDRYKKLVNKIIFSAKPLIEADLLSKVPAEKLKEEIDKYLLVLMSNWVDKKAKLICSAEATNKLSELYQLYALSVQEQAEKRGYDRHVAQMFSIEDAQSKKISKLKEDLALAEKKGQQEILDKVKNLIDEFYVNDWLIKDEALGFAIRGAFPNWQALQKEG